MMWRTFFLWWTLAWWRPTGASLLPGPPAGATVAGVAWRDDDVNGAWDAAETLLSGVQVYLRRCGDAMPITAVQTTDMAGTFRFTGVMADSWQAVFSPPERQESQYGFTLQSVPADDPNVDSVPKDSTPEPETGVTKCMSGSQESVNAGLYHRATVGGRVWLDADADGVLGPAEAGISGAVVATACHDGRFQNETLTVDGAYTLALPLGDCYLIFTVPDEFVVSHMPANSISNDPRVVSQVLIADDTSTFDLGLYPGGTVGDLVWEDRNANGLQDDEEPGLGNVTVRLVSCKDNGVVDTQTTDGEGQYWFTTVPVGTYRVTFQAPSDRTYHWRISTEGVTSTTSVSHTDCFAVGAGQVQDSVKAGVHEVSTLRCQVWEDANGDGEWSAAGPAAEAGLPGLAVTVACQAFHVTGRTAGRAGRLTVEVPAGPCTVTFTRPVDHVVSFLPAAGCRVTRTEVVCRLTASGGSQDVVVGMYAGTTVGGHVWQDAHTNGARDTTDPVAPLPGAVVRLYDAETGTPVGDPQRTDRAGAYRFTAVPVGWYYVQFEAPSVANGGPTYHVSHPHHDDMAPTVGQTDQFSVDQRQRILGRDARFYKAALLTSKVWLDADHNGRADRGEGGVADVVVAVACQGGRFAQAMPTPASGVYAFAVPAGTCELTFSRRSGYAISHVPAGCIVNASHIACSVTLAAGSVSGVPMGVSFEICGDYAELPVSPSCTGVLQRAPHRAEAACYVVLQAAAGGRIGLRFTALNLGGLDGVYVWDGDAPGTVDAALVRAANSAIPDVVTSEGSTVYVYWAAFGSGSRTGWSLNYYDATSTAGEEPPLCAAWTTAAAGGNLDFSIAMHPVTAASQEHPELQQPQPTRNNLRCAVWEDTSADGVWDASESGLPEVEIAVTCPDFSSSGKTEASDDGTLGVRTFSVPIGPCTVTFTRLEDYNISFAPSVGCGVTDSEVVCVVPMGNDSKDIVIGMYPDGSVQNRIHLDINGNGVADPGEPPLADVTVSLQTCEGAELQTLTTDETGTYEFRVRPGQSYQLEFTAPSAAYSPASVASGCIAEMNGQWQMNRDVTFQKFTPCGSAFAHPDPRALSSTPAGPLPAPHWRLPQPQPQSTEPQTVPLWLSEGQRIGTVTTTWPDPYTFVVVYHVDPGYRILDDDHNVFIGTAVHSSIDHFPAQYEAQTMEHGSDFMMYTRDSTGDYTITVEGLPNRASAARPYYAIIQASVQCSAAAEAIEAQARPYLAGLRLGLGLGVLLGVAATALARLLCWGCQAARPGAVPCALDDAETPV
eukprot:EG_transcript_653